MSTFHCMSQCVYVTWIWADFYVRRRWWWCWARQSPQFEGAFQQLNILRQTSGHFPAILSCQHLRVLTWCWGNFQLCLWQHNMIFLETCRAIFKPSLYEQNQMFWTIRGNDFQLFVPIKLDILNKMSGELLRQNPGTPNLDVFLTLTSGFCA